MSSSGGGSSSGATKARPAVAAKPAPRAGATARATDDPPTAAEFRAIVVGATNQYSIEHGSEARIVRADCVRASARSYMCSYAVRKEPAAPIECHLMQARWTPELASSFTVTLAGRTRKCGSLREAIRSLD